jgi:hypothetical protein
MTHRQVEVLYCDDIRQELSGKVSYIGSYGPEMWVQEFPATLPQFCVAVWINIPSDNATSGITVRFIRDEEIITESHADLPDPDNFPRSQESDGPPSFLGVQTAFILSPFVIDAPCTLRVRAITADGEELKGVALKVRQTPNNVFSN